MSDFVVGEALDVLPRTPGGPCPWPFDETCCDVDVECEIQDRAVAAATEVLWAATGRRFGQCSVRLRPCRRDCWGERAGWWEFGSSWPYPALWDGAWLNLGCGGCSGDCNCTSVEEVVLSGGATAILEVTIDGSSLPPTSYRLDDGRILVRQDGGRWPLCQDLSKPAGEPGTWTVQALYGEEVPDLGVLALAELACEFIKACVGGECRLPQRVQTLSRAGVSMSFPDPNQALTDGFVGLYWSDLFIRTYNPNHLGSRARIYNPDAPSPRVG